MPLVAAALAGLLSVSSCWDVYDAAMQLSAQAPRPHVVSYDEDIDIQANGAQLVRERAHVDYREDGVALVLDDRYGTSPVITTRLDPGPPELGPYGSARAAWMNRSSWPQLRAVANVRVNGNESCTLRGVVGTPGAPVYHLVFQRARKAPGLEDLWVDADSNNIERVILTGLVENTATSISYDADFDLRLAIVDGFNVVSHVAWSHDGYSGDYTFENFSFPEGVAALDSVAP
jgi:hypothetical protein